MSDRDQGLLKVAGLSVPEAATFFKRTPQAVYRGISPRERREVSSREHYFSAADAAALVHYLRQADSDRLGSLLTYIGDNFAPKKKRKGATAMVEPVARRGRAREEATLEVEADDRGWMLPFRAGLQQLKKACTKADEVTVIFTRNESHLNPRSGFRDILHWLLSDEQPVRGRIVLLVPAYELANAVRKLLRVSGRPVRRENESPEAFSARLQEFQRMQQKRPCEIIISTGGQLPAVVTRVKEASKKGRLQKEAYVLRAFVFVRFSIEEIDPVDAESLFFHAYRPFSLPSMREQK